MLSSCHVSGFGIRRTWFRTLDGRYGEIGALPAEIKDLYRQELLRTDWVVNTLRHQPSQPPVLTTLGVSYDVQRAPEAAPDWWLAWLGG